MRVRLPDARYRDRERVVATLEETLGRVSSLAGVESAALTTGVPMGRANEERYLVDGQASPTRDRLPVALTQWVSPGYHRTFRIELLGGRFFTAADREGTQAVAIVDDEFERRTFAGGAPGSALGRRVQLVGEPGRWRTIVGVVRHIRHASLDEQPRVEVYAPYLQMEPAWQLEIGRAMDVAIRSSRDAGSVVAGVRDVMKGIDPDVPLSHVRAMDEALSESMAPRVLNAGLLGLFAVVALLLCVVGLYGVMSYAVTQRTREIGVRIALGAAPREILRLLLGGSARIVLTGLAFGAGIAIAAGRLLRGMLYAVAPGDPLTFALAAFVLTLVAAFAAYLPARRAARLDPVVALSRE
jgi:predicted permease